MEPDNNRQLLDQNSPKNFIFRFLKPCRTLFSWTVDYLVQPPKPLSDLPPEIKFPVTIEGCDHGVLCLSNRKTAAVYLWNPSIGHLKKLPRPNLLKNTVAFRLGIGHVDDNDDNGGDFKVVMVTRTKSDRPLHYPFKEKNELFTRTSRFSVYSLKADSWTTVDAPMPDIFLPQGCPWNEFTYPNKIEGNHCSPSMVFEGSVHWSIPYEVARSDFPKTKKSHKGNAKFFAIATFNLRTETFTLLKTPIAAVIPGTLFSVGTSFGFLTVTCTNREYNTAEVWAMIDYESRDEDSWHKRAFVDLATICPPMEGDGLTLSLSQLSLKNSFEVMIEFGVVGDKYLVIQASKCGVFLYNIDTENLGSPYPSKEIRGLVGQFVPTDFPLCPS